MIILNVLKKWSEKSRNYLNSKDLVENWLWFGNPRLYPLKINSSNFVLLKQFETVGVWYACVELLKCLARMFRLFFVNSLYFQGPDKTSNLISANVTGLIISHRVLGVDDKIKCPYFGFIVQALHSNKINVEMNFINHSTSSRGAGDLNCVGDFKFELKVAWLATCEFFSVIKHCFVDFKFSVFLFGGCFSNGLVDSLRVAIRVDELLNRNTHIKFVLHTLEGHAWEHSLLACARRNNRDVKFVGFQQAPINITSRAIFDLLLGYTPPNYILCSGQYAANLFKKFTKKNSIFLIGTNRSLEGRPSKKRNDNYNNVLVVPEGMITEVRIFLSYIKEVSDHSPEFNFLFTLHPTMHEKEFYREVNRYGLAEYVTLVKQPLGMAAKKCHCVLYRGSTGVLEAVRNGCSPIFVQDRFGTCVEIFNDGSFQGLVTTHGSQLQHIVHEKVDFDQFYKTSLFIFSPFNAEELLKIKIW